jgi:hypothetical protein
MTVYSFWRTRRIYNQSALRLDSGGRDSARQARLLRPRSKQRGCRGIVQASQRPPLRLPPGAEVLDADQRLRQNEIVAASSEPSGSPRKMRSKFSARLAMRFSSLQQRFCYSATSD